MNILDVPITASQAQVLCHITSFVFTQLAVQALVRYVIPVSLCLLLVLHVVKRDTVANCKAVASAARPVTLQNMLQGC